MRFSVPSVQIMVSKSFETIKRFPFVLFSAFVACVAGIWLVELEFSTRDEFLWLSGLTFISVLGISFFFGLKTLSESLKLDTLKSLGVSVLGLILLSIYYFFSYDKISEGPDMHGYRYLLLFLVSHLFVSFSAFLKNQSIREFWGYNKTLFLEFLISVLYSAVLYVGLSIALLSLDVLIELDINEKRYFQLWIFMTSVFNTIFFLSRVPKTDCFDKEVTDYPKALKLFVQYVLIPLVTIYILILYTYMGKIIVQWELPTGWVANLVLSFSIAGIFSLLLLYPIKDDKVNNWIRLYSKSYFLALIPLVILLFVSIGTRIAEYGVTINRFFVATLAVWLSGIVVYFIISKSKNIKVIPISLCLVALGISYGPFSAFSVSERSQKGRLENLLYETGRLSDNNKVQNSDIVLSLDQNTEISSINRYMVNNHGVESFQSFFETDINSLLEGSRFKDLANVSDAEKVTQLLNVKYVGRYESVESTNQDFFNFSTVRNSPVSIDGYDLFFDNLICHDGLCLKSKIYDASEWRFYYSRENDTFKVSNKENNSASISFELFPYVEKILSEQETTSETISSTYLTLNMENDQLAIMVLIDDISGSLENEQIESINSIRLKLFLKEKQ